MTVIGVSNGYNLPKYNQISYLHFVVTEFLITVSTLLQSALALLIQVMGKVTSPDPQPTGIMHTLDLKKFTSGSYMYLLENVFRKGTVKVVIEISPELHFVKKSKWFSPVYKVIPFSE